ncbi:MAG: tRNA lysidine(34) synthetase TilS, partial [Candidatus Peregrinibacteria bacterium]
MLLQIQKTLRQLASFKRVVVGVSGGADSVALALALKELRYEVIVAHLNHRLRGDESDADAEFVKNFAQKLRVPYVIEKAEIPRHGNLEDNARKIRYEFLENARKRFRADCIAVAHHRDDQMETVLMHLLRGAGPRGLAGMQLQRGKLLRPLLDTTKKEILEFLRKRGQPFRTDST